MVVDLSKTFIDLDKKEIGNEVTYAVAERVDGKLEIVRGETGVLLLKQKEGALTLKKVCEQTLLIDDPNEKISKEDKIKRSKLGFKILNCEDDIIDLELHEITFLQDLIYQKNPTLIASQAVNHLEPK